MAGETSYPVFVTRCLDSACGRAVQLNPELVHRRNPDIDALWMLTLCNPDDTRTQYVLMITAVPATGQILQLHGHYLTVSKVHPDLGTIAAPHLLVAPSLKIDPSWMYQHPLRLREGGPQALRLARAIVEQIIDGRLPALPRDRDGLANWRLAIGLGIGSALSPEGAEFERVAEIKRGDDQ